MKKTLAIAAAALLLASVAGFVQGKSRSGKPTYDMYVLHPAITISGYTSQM